MTCRSIAVVVTLSWQTYLCCYNWLKHKINICAKCQVCANPVTYGNNWHEATCSCKRAGSAKPHSVLHSSARWGAASIDSVSRGWPTAQTTLISPILPVVKNCILQLANSSATDYTIVFQVLDVQLVSSHTIFALLFYGKNTNMKHK